MNLISYVRQCEARTGFNDSTFQVVWKEYVNAAVREFTRKYPWPGLERELSTTLYSGERYLVLPHHVDHVTSILNVTDRVPIMARGNWGKQEPVLYANLQQGRPLEYQKAGHVATAIDPSNYVWFKSSHASDVDLIYITGTVAASGATNQAFTSILQSESISAQGTTPVTLSTLFSKIETISKATSTNGDFFFFDSSQYVSFIPAPNQDARFRRLEFMFIPEADKSVRIKYLPVVPLLVNDQQSPHPTVKDDFVIEKAIALWQRYQTQYQKSQFHDAAAIDILASETNKEENFTEPFSEIKPEIPGAWDPDDDWYRGGY
jgi:hypothetical protein